MKRILKKKIISNRNFSVFFDFNEYYIDDNLIPFTIKIVESFIKNQNINHPVEISISLVGSDEIKSLNNEYRNKDKTTDVLSFPIDDYMLGDVIINIDKIKAQSRLYKTGFIREFSYLLTHSLLHLVGYDHMNDWDKKIMRINEEKILSGIKK